MNLHLYVRVSDISYGFSFLNSENYSRLFLPNHFIIDVYKIHNHSYCFKGFFYNSLHIYSYNYCNSKSKLFYAVQNLLKQELYDVVQF